jgi:catechol 1,2-dioxygenase
MHGRVLNCVTKEPIKNALVQVWQAAINGLYDQQDPKQTTGNLHGQFRSDENGEYVLYCLKPTPYPIEANCEYYGSISRCESTDNCTAPAAKLLDLMDKHHYRPAHIHAYVSLLLVS